MNTHTTALIVALMAFGPVQAWAQDCTAIGSEISVIDSSLETGDHKAARKMAEALRDDAPNCVEAHLALARALRARMDAASGLKRLSAAKAYHRSLGDALALDPDNLDARTRQIGFLVNAPSIAGGSRKKARARIAELRSINPLQGARMHLMLVRTAGDPEEVLNAVTKVIALDPDDYLLRSERMRRLILTDRAALALSELREWADPEPWIALEHLYLRGAARIYLGRDWTEAERDLRAFLQARATVHHPRLPSSARAQALLGDALLAQGRHAEAGDAYKTALADDPDNERATDGMRRLDETGDIGP